MNREKGEATYTQALGYLPVLECLIYPHFYII